MLFPKRANGELTERWMINADEIQVGDVVMFDYVNCPGLGVMLERVSRSEPADGRHGDCKGHWLVAFEGRSPAGQCYTMGKATFRRVVPEGVTPTIEPEDGLYPGWEDLPF